MNIASLISAIRSESRAMIRQLGFLDNRFASIGSISQCHALIELNSRGQINSKELSNILNLDKSTTSRLVAQLLDNNLCSIRSDRGDRRNKLISLTEKGLKVVDEINKEADVQVKQALELVSEDERDVILRGLSLYAKALCYAHEQNKLTINSFENNKNDEEKNT